MATELVRKKELILESEKVFANQLGSAVFEKPSVNLWMVLLPILFLHFVYRMQKYKQGRMGFNREFMITRQRAMDIAIEAVEKATQPDVERVVQQSDLAEPLVKPYATWVRVLAEHYMDLLSAKGDTFELLVRSAYLNSSDYLLALNSLTMAEKQFYSALKPRLAETEGAVAIIAVIEERSHQLRREQAAKIFP